MMMPAFENAATSRTSTNSPSLAGVVSENPKEYERNSSANTHDQML